MYRNEDYISTGYNYLFLGIWNLSILFSDICSGTVDIHSIITTELVCAVTIGGDTHMAMWCSWGPLLVSFQTLSLGIRLLTPKLYSPLY